MTLGANYDKLCPLFDFGNSGGVLFPYFPMALGQSDGWGKFIDLDGTDTSTLFAELKFPFDVRLVTCQAAAVSDAVGVKLATVSTEPVIGVVYGTNPMVTVAAGTSCGVISCTGAGAIGTTWEGTTDAITISTSQSIGVYLKTTVAGATSANHDGGAVPILWFAVVNSG